MTYLIVRSTDYAWVNGLTFTGPCAFSMAHNWVLRNDWKYEVFEI